MVKEVATNRLVVDGSQDASYVSSPRIPGPSADVFRSLVGVLSKAPGISGVRIVDDLMETEMVQLTYEGSDSLFPLEIEYIPADSKDPAGPERITVAQSILSMNQGRLLNNAQLKELKVRWQAISHAEGLEGVNLWTIGGVNGSSVAVTSEVAITPETTREDLIQMVEEVRAATPHVRSALTGISEK